MTDLMDMIDDEHDARVSESIHQIQLLMEISNSKYIGTIKHDRYGTIP